MKDIYKHLNDIDIDLDEFEEMEVSEFERAKVKKELLNKIHTSHQKKWKKSLTAASLVLGLITSALFGLSFTANAEKIPVIGNIYKIFNYNDALYEDYHENSNPINGVAEGNGLKLTLNEAIYDGETIIVSYTIDTSKDLGDSFYIDGVAVVEGKEENTINEVYKIGENKYTGKSTITVNEPYQTLDVDWKINYMLPNLTTDQKRIIGDWNFKFQLNKAEITIQSLTQVIEQGGIKLNFEKLIITPQSFHIEFEQTASVELTKEWDSNSIDFEVKDDVGNVYISKAGGGTGSDSFLYNMSASYDSLDPTASKLIITPKVTLADYDLVEYNEDGTIRSRGRSINSTADIKEFNMDKIIIEIEK